MPSPFPGMDPYLEHPTRWPGLHTHLIVQIQSQLNTLLAPRYVAMIEERVYVSDPLDAGRQALIPDLHIKPQLPAQAPPIRVGSESMLAVAEPIELELIDDEIHDTYLNIVTVDEQRVVTVIEVLSPTNKVHSARGQEQFLRKRQEVLQSATHWVEIDLLRDGERSAPAEMRHLGDYFVYVARATPQRRRHCGWPIKLPQRLPVVSVPLTTDTNVDLDLQYAIEAVYERGSYQLLIDYKREPVPPLPEQYAIWAKELLKTKGLLA